MSEEANGPFSESSTQPGFAPECMACPIGLVFFAMRNTKPEALEHLTRAAHELISALKIVVDGYAERSEKAQEIRRINID